MSNISKDIKKDLWDYIKITTSAIPCAGGSISECINLYQEQVL
jgi:hypothetical protein